MDFSNNTQPWYEHWLAEGQIRPLDLQWIQQLQQHLLTGAKGSVDESVLLAGVLVSAYLAAGHTCVDLHALYNDDLADLSFEPSPRTILSNLGVLTSLDWGQNIQSSGLAVTMNEIGAKPSPLVVTESGLLYLSRYYVFETKLLDFIKRQESKGRRQVDANKLAVLFPKPSKALELDWQKIAVANAASMDFSIISGGPGTGKTTTVTKLLALLVWQALEELSETSGFEVNRTSNRRKDKAPRIALAAPTGKAAARLTESISAAKSKLDLNQDILDAIPETATTLHRLLGADYGRAQFRHDKGNPLHIDILLVDEVSMVDMPMMAKLIDALPDDARLILLGDKDQLSSVEAGNVLGDLTLGIQREKVTRAQFTGLTQTLPNADLELLSRQIIEQAPPIQRHLSLLSKSYRFDDKSGIGLLAAAVNLCHIDRAISVLNGQFDNVSWKKLTKNEDGPDISALAQGYREYWNKVRQGVSPEELHSIFSQYQILTAVRQGAFGVESVNDALEKHFYRQGFIESHALWYSGKAVMMTRNDASTGLFNGDVGLCLADEHNTLRVWFILPNGEIKGFLPSRISSFELVFAMTVHKSQGSEFERVTMLLPNTVSPVLGKELIYTGITRAKTYFELWGSAMVLQEGLKKRVQRRSGLTKAIWS